MAPHFDWIENREIPQLDVTKNVTYKEIVEYLDKLVTWSLIVQQLLDESDKPVICWGRYQWLTRQNNLLEIHKWVKKIRCIVRDAYLYVTDNINKFLKQGSCYKKVHIIAKATDAKNKIDSTAQMYFQLCCHVQDMLDPLK